MEKNLDKNMEEAFRLPGVVGVLCVDTNGLCLGSRGNIPQETSGSLSALATQASLLSQGYSSANPVICLESEAGMVVVKKTDQITTAIFKSA